MANLRRSYIINPKFQYKFSFIICSLIFIGSLIYPITIYDLFNYIIELNPGVADQTEAHRNNLIQFLVLMQISFMGVVFIFCIFISHKVAGPIYKLSTYLQNLRSTGEVTSLTFRDGDNFPELADEINKTVDFLVSKSEEEIQELKDLSAYLENLSLVIPEDKKPVLLAAQTKIKEFIG